MHSLSMSAQPSQWEAVQVCHQRTRDSCRTRSRSLVCRAQSAILEAARLECVARERRFDPAFHPPRIATYRAGRNICVDMVGYEGASRRGAPCPPDVRHAHSSRRTEHMHHRRLDSQLTPALGRVESDPDGSTIVTVCAYAFQPPLCNIRTTPALSAPTVRCISNSTIASSLAPPRFRLSRSATSELGQPGAMSWHVPSHPSSQARIRLSHCVSIGPRLLPFPHWPRRSGAPLPLLPWHGSSPPRMQSETLRQLADTGNDKPCGTQQPIVSATLPFGIQRALARIPIRTAHKGTRKPPYCLENRSNSHPERHLPTRARLPLHPAVCHARL